MSSALAIRPNSPANAGAGLVTKNGAPMPPSASSMQTQKDVERHHELDERWKWFIGDITGHFKSEPGQPDLNVNTNRMGTVVGTGVNYLYGKQCMVEVQFNGKPVKGTGKEDAQDWLDGCLGNDNKRMKLFSKLGQNGGIFGHVFAKIIEPNPDKMRPYCRVVPLDPAQVTAISDPNDCDTVTKYVIDWTVPSTQNPYSTTARRAQVIMRIDPDQDADDYEEGLDPDSTWQISDWLYQANQWTMLGAPVEWPHPWAPIIDWQNLPIANQHWGQSDIPKNVRHLNDVLNLMLSNINAIAKHHSFPWMYAAGVGSVERIELGPGKLTQFQASDGKIAAIEAHGDIAGLLSFCDFLMLSIDEQTHVPAVATGRFKDLPKVASGVALQMMGGPLLFQTEHKHRTYGDGHEEIGLRCLALGGFGDGTGLDGWQVITHWQNPLPTDDLAAVQVAQGKSLLGFSDTTLIGDLGGDPEVEAQNKADEAKAKLKAMANGEMMPPPLMLPAAPPPGQQPPQNGNEPGGDAAKNAANGAPQTSGQGKIPTKGGK